MCILSNVWFMSLDLYFTGDHKHTVHHGSLEGHISLVSFRLECQEPLMRLLEGKVNDNLCCVV